MFCSRPPGGRPAVLASVSGSQHFPSLRCLFTCRTWSGDFNTLTLNSTLLLLQDRCSRSWCQSASPGSAPRETSSLFSRWRSTTSSSPSPWRNRRDVNISSCEMMHWSSWSVTQTTKRGRSEVTLRHTWWFTESYSRSSIVWKISVILKPRVGCAEGGERRFTFILVLCTLYKRSD